MNNLTVKNNELIYMRYTELISITPCGKNSIRFRAFPDCKADEESYTLIPRGGECIIKEYDRYATLTNGTLTVKLEENGKLYLTIDGVKQKNGLK